MTGQKCGLNVSRGARGLAWLRGAFAGLTGVHSRLPRHPLIGDYLAGWERARRLTGRA